jgi:hemerythrin-like domain-containing protein
MINTMIACLSSEHQKLNNLTMQLALTATRLASDPDATTTQQRALELWDEIRRILWPHLQIEDELVFSWGEAHHAIPEALLDILKVERQEMRKLVAALPALSTDLVSETQSGGDQPMLAQTLLALAQTLDSHLERYDGEIIPSLSRSLFHRDK